MVGGGNADFVVVSYHFSGYIYIHIQSVYIIYIIYIYIYIYIYNVYIR